MASLERILISACLLGEPVRFDGTAKKLRHPLLERWKREGRLLPVCPEVAVGLAVPREAVEISAGNGADVLKGKARVLSRSGTDFSGAFLSAAQATLARARAEGCRFALLKENSPSCGVRRIHDGTFSGRLMAGSGVTAALLKQAGLKVYAEHEIEQLAAALRQAERDSAH